MKKFPFYFFLLFFTCIFYAEACATLKRSIEDTQEDPSKKQKTVSKCDLPTEIWDKIYGYLDDTTKEKFSKSDELFCRVHWQAQKKYHQTHLRLDFEAVDGGAFPTHPDLTKHPNLISLSLEGYEESYRDGQHINEKETEATLVSVDKYLQSTDKLAVLNLEHFRASGQWTICFINSLTNNTSLHTLKLNISDFDVKTFKVVGAFIEKTKTLTSLGFNWTCLYDDESAKVFPDGTWDPIAKALNINKSIEELYLSGWAISHNDLISFSKNLSINTTIKKLSIEELFTHENEDDLGAFGEDSVVKGYKPTDDDDYGDVCDVHWKSREALGKVFYTNKTIKDLTLIFSNMNKDSLVLITRHLEQNKTLTSLKIENESFWANGNHLCGPSILDNLKNNKTLKYLDLSGFPVKDFAKLGLVMTLEKNTTLKKLNLDYCCMDGEIIKMIRGYQPLDMIINVGEKEELFNA